MRKNINAFELPPVAEDPNAGSYIKAGLSSEAVYFLRAAFNQFDPDKAGTIDFREVVSAVFLKGMKFYDKEVYQLLRFYEQRPEGRINFKEFIQLLKYVELSYINLKDLANIKNDYEYLLSKPKETTLNIHALNIDVEKLGLSDKKLDKLKEAFSKIDLDKDAAIVLDDITKVIPPDGNSVNIENIKLFFDELGFENDGILTFNEIILGMTTKKGILGVYNFLVFAKISLSAESPDNQQCQKDKFVTLDAYTNENVSDITVLDLVEAFELLDVDYTLRIKSSVLKEHENRLQMILSAEEKKIYDELIKLNNDDIDFDLFIKWTIEEGFGSKDVVSVARKFNEYWAIVDRGNRLSFSETSQEKGYDYLNNIDKPKDKPARTSQDIHSLNHLKSAHPISITDIEPVQNFIMGAKRRSSLNTGIEGVTIQSLQRFSAVFGEGSIERPAIESSIYQVSLESLAEDEFETVKNFLNLKRQELSAGPNSIFRDDHFTQAENDFLKHENNKLREELAKKEELITSLREDIENKINQLNATKEVEKKLEDKVTELQDQLNKNSQNTDKIQQKLAAKVKELLLKDDTISHLEVVNKDKIKELENLQAEKTKSEQTLQDNFVNIKKKLDYVTQKFSEYLTQNTALQSEVHEKDDKIRKTEYALKQEKERSQGTITKLEAKITDHEAKIADLETKLGSKIQEVNKHALEIQLEIEHLKLELAEKEDYIEDLENMKDSLYQSEKDIEELKNKLIETQAHYNNSQSVIASLEKRLEVLVNEHNVWKKASLYKGEFELADYEQYFEDYMQKILNLEAKTIINGDIEDSSLKTQEGIDRNYLQKLSLIEERLSFFQDKIVDRKRELMSFSNFPTSLIVDTQKFAFKQPNNAKQDMKEYTETGKENPSAISTASQMTKRLIEHEEEETPHTALTANESLLSHQDFSDRVRMRNELDFQMKDPKQVGSANKINENSQLQTTYFTTEGDEEGRIETEQSEESRQIKMNHLENERITKIQQALSTYCERMSEIFNKKMLEFEEKLERFELVNAKGANIFKSFVHVKNKNIELEKELEAVKREYEGQIKVVAQQDKMLIDLKKQKDKELAKQHKKFDQLLSKLTQEIVVLKNGGLSDI